MKIAIVGCGAVGSYYGAMLSRAGQDVHFLLRSDYEQVRRNGVQVLSPKGDFNARPACAKTPERIGHCDVVLIALKTTANDQFPALLPPLVGSHTAIVTLQNGLGNEELLARIFPIEQILGGLCFVCLNRIAPGVVRHLDHGTIVLGEFRRWPEPRTHDLAAAFRHAGVACKVADNLARAHWEKLVWNIPFNGLGVASAAGYDALLREAGCLPSEPERRSPDRLDPKPDAQRADLEIGAPQCSGVQSVNRDSTKSRSTPALQPCLTTDQLLADSRWAETVRELMLEVIATANAIGLEVSESLAEQQIERTRSMGAYRASTLLDFELGRPLELESVFREPLRQARQAGLATPRLLALCNVLENLDRLRVL